MRFSAIAICALIAGVALGQTEGPKLEFVQDPTKDYPFPEILDWPDPSRWEIHYMERVELFRRENAALDPAKRYAVFVGDSLTEGFSLDHYFYDAPVLDRGITSDGIAFMPDRVRPRGLINRMEASILNCQPRVVFLLMGTNDLPAAEVPMEYWLTHYESIIDTTTTRFPDVTFVVQTLPPTGAAYKKHEFLNPRILEFNEKLRELAQRKNLPLIDIHPLVVGEDGLLKAEYTRDGLHLLLDAYKPWAEEARKIMEKELTGGVPIKSMQQYSDEIRKRDETTP